jgi:hypothetical protein
MITQTEVQSIVKSVCRLADVPMNENFKNIGLSSVQLQNIQKKFIDVFKKTTKDVKFSDTIYTLTDKLNGK